MFSSIIHYCINKQLTTYINQLLNYKYTFNVYIHPKIQGLITHETKYKYNLNFDYITYITVTYKNK